MLDQNTEHVAKGQIWIPRGRTVLGHEAGGPTFVFARARELLSLVLGQR